ncbi:MAG: glycosyltransferase family 4 protein [Pseudomonadota bacterium]|nr:glycosyltransferase family 4 protein [Pseudomonadota bacterium]
MRVLVLDEEFPYPTNTGKRTRSFNLYRRLATQFPIRYVGYGEAGSAAAEALSRVGIEPVAVPVRLAPKHGPAFYLRLLSNLFSPLPYIVTSHYSCVYQDAVQDNLAQFRPDLVLCEWTPYAVYVKGISLVKKLVSTHNIEADIWQRYYENETNLLRSWYIREQWRKVERFERAALGWVDGAVAVSDRDHIRLARWQPRLPMTVVPNGADLDYFRSAPQPELRRHLVFSGSMDWRPNQDAARYFVRAILPLLRQARPDLECTFVGRSPPVDIQALGKVPGVHVTGTVHDVRPYVQGAAVYVVPLRIGGGSRLKILEALAMGRAVVSTSVGAEGLDVVHDRHVLLADDPRSFAESVLRLLDDPERCRRLAAEGRCLVEQRYGWDALAEKFRSFIHEVAEKAVPPILVGEVARPTTNAGRRAFAPGDGRGAHRP